MPQTTDTLARLQETLTRAFRERRPITLKSALLRNAGEEKLELIVDRLFRELGQTEMTGPAYAAIRELVQNASKANLKRVLFDDLHVNPNDRQNYHEGMDVFRRRLTQTRLSEHAKLIQSRGLYFTISFHYTADVLCVSVRNPFVLFPAEEMRVREKFTQSNGADNLYEYYQRYGDSVEGAGMGIAMVQILLHQAGFSHRSFSIFSDLIRQHTVARIILPLTPEYVLPRDRFAREAQRRNIPADQLREEMRRGFVQFPVLRPTIEMSEWYSGK